MLIVSSFTGSVVSSYTTDMKETMDPLTRFYRLFERWAVWSCSGGWWRYWLNLTAPTIVMTLLIVAVIVFS